MSNLNWDSPASSSTNSASLIPNVEFIATTPSTFDANYVSEQVHNLIFHKEDDRDIMWEFLTTKAPVPASKLVENKTIVELLLAVEPGPKVDYDGLRTNLALLRPYVSKTSSGPALLSFFESLLQLQAGWLLGAAKLEAFRCYDRTLFTYYVEWYEGFRKDTAARALDESEIAYEKECQEHAVARAAGSYVQQEQQLAKEVDGEAIKLLTCKTSPEMWKYSRILWAIVEQYQRYIQTRNALALQKKFREDEGKRKAEEILQRRAEVKKEDAKIRKQQMGMQQQDANNLFIQQEWMADMLLG